MQYLRKRQRLVKRERHLSVGLAIRQGVASMLLRAMKAESVPLGSLLDVRAGEDGDEQGQVIPFLKSLLLFFHSRVYSFFFIFPLF